MKSPTFSEFFGGNPLGMDAYFKDASNLPDLWRFDEAEKKEFAEFVKERHHQHEWEAFFQYVALPPEKRGVSWVAGVLARIVGL